jgi:hypothetical protein
LWCWDDACWLGFYCVNVLGWLDLYYITTTSRLGFCNVFDVGWLGLGNVISVGWLELGSGVGLGLFELGGPSSGGTFSLSNIVDHLLRGTNVLVLCLHIPPNSLCSSLWQVRPTRSLPNRGMPLSFLWSTQRP